MPPVTISGEFALVVAAICGATVVYLICSFVFYTMLYNANPQNRTPEKKENPSGQ